jgi:hypothetical protein
VERSALLIGLQVHILGGLLKKAGVFLRKLRLIPRLCFRLVCLSYGPHCGSDGGTGSGDAANDSKSRA